MPEDGQDADGSPIMRLGSYNIQFGRGKDGRFDLDRIVAELGELDLIALQEVETYAARSGDVHQPHEIAARLPQMHWVYGPGIDVDASRIVDGRPVHRRRQFGNMILSRWPILSSISHTLPKVALDGIFHLQRILLETVIDTPQGPLRFCTTHLDHVAPGIRLPQVAMMRDILCRGAERGASWGGMRGDTGWFDRPEPPQPVRAIVMGDMNFTPGGPEYDLLLGDRSQWHGRTTRATGLVDAWLQSGHDEAAGDTLPRDGRPAFRIDHCFVTANLRHAVIDMRIDGAAQGSDHQPIFVDLDLSRLPS